MNINDLKAYNTNNNGKWIDGRYVSCTWCPICNHYYFPDESRSKHVRCSGCSGTFENAEYLEAFVINQLEDFRAILWVDTVVQEVEPSVISEINRWMETLHRSANFEWRIMMKAYNKQIAS